MHASSAIIGMSAFAVAALAQTQSSAIQFNSFPPQNVVPGQSIPLKYTAPDANSVRIRPLAHRATLPWNLN